MKSIDLFVLEGDASRVYHHLGYDACLQGSDPEVTSSPEQLKLEWFPRQDHQNFDGQLPINMHSVLEWTGIGQKDILCVHPKVWTVISKQMLSLIQTIGAFEYQALPIRIWDDLIKSGGDPGKPATRHNDDYLLLYLPSELKILDHRQSDYEFLTGEYGRPTGIKRRFEATEEELRDLEQRPRALTLDRVVLTVPESQLPPLFRLTAQPSTVFMPAWAAKKLAQADLDNVSLRHSLVPFFCQDDVLATAND